MYGRYVAIFAIGMFMHNRPDESTSRLGSLLVAGAVLSAAKAEV